MKESRREFAGALVTLVLLAVVFLILLAADAGVWVFLAVGAVALIALIVAASILMRRPRSGAVPEHPGRPAGAASPIADGVRRVLVIATDSCPPDELGKAVVDLGRVERTSVFVVAPAISSRAARWTGDERAYEAASQHLDETLRALEELGVEAKGHIGAHDPLQAADDGLREFPADEIVFVVHAGDEANWLEQGIVDEARARYALQVHELTLERSTPPAG